MNAECIISKTEDSPLDTPITRLPLARRVKLNLAANSILYVSDIVSKSADDLLVMRNFGEGSLNSIRSAIGELGLSLKDVPRWH